MKRALTIAAVAGAAVSAGLPATAEAHTLSYGRATAAARDVARDVYLGVPSAVNYDYGDCRRRSAHAFLCQGDATSAEGIVCSYGISVRFRSSRSYSILAIPVGEPRCA